MPVGRLSPWRHHAPHGRRRQADLQVCKMRIITLIPQNKRAKQIIKQHGERWEVVRLRYNVLFDERHGPWLLVQPITEDRAPADSYAAAKIESATRWIHEFNDDEFKVAP